MGCGGNRGFLNRGCGRGYFVPGCLTYILALGLFIIMLVSLI